MIYQKVFALWRQLLVMPIDCNRCARRWGGRILVEYGEPVRVVVGDVPCIWTQRYHSLALFCICSSRSVIVAGRNCARTPIVSDPKPGVTCAVPAAACSDGNCSAARAAWLGVQEALPLRVGVRCVVKWVV